MKRFLFLATFILSLFLSPSIVADSSGNCGDNITWTFDGSHLILTGTGDMYNYIYYPAGNGYDYNSTSPFGKSVRSVTISWGITSIGNNAFMGCTNLSSIEIPNSVTSIGDCAFYNCKSLTSIEIPNSVTSIGGSAFCRCESLTSIEIPNSVTSIEDHTFNNCESLTSIEIPNSVTSIGKRAFYNCRRLTSIEIPNSVTSIEDYTFSRCYQLKSVTIGNSVTSIGDSAFSDCLGLKSVTIGNSVTSIGGSAFLSCISLTSIEIPNSVTSIWDGAFFGCKSLQKITSYAEEPPVCRDNTFDINAKNNCILEVPDNSIIKYRSADVWKDFLNMSGVESVTNDYEISVRSENGEIIVTGADGNADMDVYSLNGVKVYRGAIKLLQVPAGILFL